MSSVAPNRAAGHDRRTAIEILRAIPDFADLLPRALHAISAAMTIEQLPARTVLLQEDEAPACLYVVLDGSVQLFSSRGSRQTTITVLPAPALVPAEAVFCDAPSLASARTLHRCTVGRIAIEDARSLARRERQFAELLSQHIALRWRDMLRDTKSLRARTTLERLVSWICAMHRESKVPGLIELPYEKAVLAGRLGMAPETLSREFARLGRFGVTVKGRRLEVADPSALVGLIDPDAAKFASSQRAAERIESGRSKSRPDSASNADPRRHPRNDPARTFTDQ